VILALVASGCASIKLVDAWKDESYTKLPIQKILIVMTAEDERSRRVAEDSVVSAFRTAGVEAIAGYTFLPGAVKINEETIEKAIEGKGFDVVLITSHENTETTSVYVPGEVRTEVVGAPYYGGRAGRGGYNRREYRTIEQPGYYQENKVVTLDTNLYETTGGGLIWSARSQSQNPQSVNDLVGPLGETIIKHLTLDGFL
jgi:hypothetical protein